MVRLFLFLSLSLPADGCALFLCLRLGSPWGAGTYAGADGSRQPSPLEIDIAKQQGIGFWETVSKHKF